MTSLQDQLLKAGLIDPKQVKQAAKDKRKQAKTKKGQPQVDPAKEAIKAAREAKAERDRALNLEREKARETKAIAAQIVQLIDSNRQSRRAGPGAEVDFHFKDGKVVKTLRVCPLVQRQLSNGVLSIAKADGRYELVPGRIATKIAERDPNSIINVADSSAPPAEDDPYKDYPIPDDLMW